MTLYAFDAIDDAVDATRAFLWPFDLGRWAKLALVMFFVGGGGASFNPAQFNTGGGTPVDGGTGEPGDPGMPDVLPDVGAEELTVILAIAAAVLLVVLLFTLVSAIMEFVFVESLRRESVTIRRYWSERWGQGLRLFGFRLVLGLLTFGIVIGLGLLVLWPLLFGGGEFSLGLLVIAIPVFVVVSILSGIVNGFTTVFVVPIMVREDRGVLSAWSRFWPTMTGQWKQYLAYVVMGFILQIAGGIVAFIAVLVLMIVPGIVLGIIGAVGLLSFGTGTTIGLALIAVSIVLGVLTLLIVSLFVAVPVQSFLRYYALFVLGDTNEAFDLIPERRRAVREDDAGPTGAPG